MKRKFNFKVFLKDNRCYNYSCYNENDDQALNKVKELYGYNIKKLEQEIGGIWLPVN